MALKRLQNEYKDLEKNASLDNVSAGPCDEHNMFEWYATIIGSSDSPYDGGIFKLKIVIPQHYPFKPPDVKFVTKIYHPNINFAGDICLDILKTGWSPALTIHKILLSICSLLTDCNPLSPLNAEAARLYVDDRSEYNKMVIKYVETYA